MASQKKGGWGFGNLVANLESRLDTILTDEPEASARQRALEQAGNANRQRSNSGRLAAASNNASSQDSREASRTRVNDRLAERLAKATQAKPPSRVSTPVHDAGSARNSGEVTRSIDVPRSIPDIEVNNNEGEEAEVGGTEDATAKDEEPPRLDPGEPGSLTSSTLPINPARVSLDGSRASTDLTRDDPSTRPSLDIPNGASIPIKSPEELQGEMVQMQSDHAQAESQRQEEMHIYLERIDALQAKLTYLAKETVAAAKEANASAGASSAEKQVAEKDEKIALLMEEGEKLSKSEMKHLQTIKKLRTKATEDEKSNADLKKKLEKTERIEAELRTKLRKSEVAERQANEKLKQLAVIDKQVEELKEDRENASELIRNLTTQLKEAKDKAAQAEKQAAEVDKGKIAGLQNELEDAQIEKKLAEDRAAAEIKKVNDESQEQVERFAIRELELKSEISGLESRLEAMRARAEEASSGPGVEGESSVKLMRQVETLQQQYALAKGNWETIEGSLNARVAALEKERDEASRRESEARKKARDIGTKSRKVDEDLEGAVEKTKNLESEISNHQELVKTLQSRLDQAEASHSDARAELERQRKVWDSEVSQRIEEEKLKWRREQLGSPRAESYATFARKGSGVDRRSASRLVSNELSGLYIDSRPASSRRSTAALPSAVSNRSLATSNDQSPSISRRESNLSLEAHNLPPTLPPTPSAEAGNQLSEIGDYDESDSPQRTIADLVSDSTAGPGVGPSVALVERMSSLVRKLESEKASFKDELNRLSAQRDDARSEVVDLMREVEAKRSSDSKGAEMEKEIQMLKSRYEASLEMLGEREEEAEELRSDVKELKKIYRELVETKVSGGR